MTCWAETRRAGPIGPRGLAEASHREKRSRLTDEAAIVAVRPRQAHGPCRARLTGRPTTSPCPSRKSRSLRTLQPSSAGRLARGRARDRNDADRSGSPCGCAGLPRHRDGRVRIDEADWRLHDLETAAEVEMLDALILGEIGGSARQRDRARRQRIGPVRDAQRHA